MYYIYLILLVGIIVASIAANSSRNPIHAVCFLVLVSIIGSFFLIFLGMDFLAFIFSIVYIGAIAVSFLSVVMLLNLRLIELQTAIVSYIPLGVLIISFFSIEFIFIISKFFILGDFGVKKYINWIYFTEYNFSSIYFFGLYLYSYYSVNFIIAGLLLFIATFGAIMIVNNNKIEIERKIQIENKQIFVDYENNLKLIE